MATAITDAELQKLLSEGLSQNEIARRTSIPRSTLRRRIENLGTPNVYPSTQNPEKAVERGNDDLEEMLTWWRERKSILLSREDAAQETQRQTYHVQKRYIEAIKRASDLERVSIMEIVNRAFKQFFRDEA
jgi:response regulator of citrate/malate metabolism